MWKTYAHSTVSVRRRGSVTWLIDARQGRTQGVGVGVEIPPLSLIFYKKLCYKASV